MSNPSFRPTIPIATKPECPDDAPAEVRAEFERLTMLLGHRVNAEDMPLLLMLATAWTTWRAAQADVARQGRVVMSGGTACPHPALAIADKAYQQIVTLSRELKITPKTR
jgi:P27 family predicted phage terminase small subunit